MNTSGGRVDEALTTLVGIQNDESVSELLPPDFDQFVGAGVVWRAELADIVHGAMHPSEFDVPGMREWLRKAWTIESESNGVRMGMADGMSAQESMGALRMGEWARESGLNTEEAAEAIRDAMERGEPMPWERSGSE